MLKLLQLLIFGHIHVWKTEEIYYHEDKDQNGKVYSRYRKVRLKCTTCGKYKVQSLR